MLQTVCVRQLASRLCVDRIRSFVRDFSSQARERGEFLKMRKCSFSSAITIIILLNVSKLSVCYFQSNHDELLSSSAQNIPSPGEGRFLVTGTDRRADNQLAEWLSDVEPENILATDTERLTSGQQEAACQLVQIVHLLRHPGCQPKAIASFACSGSCTSSVKTSTSNLWRHVRSCSCCQQTGSQEATFALDCPSLDPPYRKVKTYAPTDCLCRSCTDLAREDLRPRELVEALAGELNNGHSK